RWRARWGRRAVLEIHDRVQTTITTTGEGLAESVAGFGVSADPGRAVDLESVWIADERLRAWHDLDRLSLTVYTPVADLTIGRQAITWGTALIFPVADLWARFSPFELDTEEKPGVDGLRILAYPASGLEVDAVVADRGERDDVSAGVRATWSLSSADLYGAAGRLWNQAMALGGITWLFDTVKLRAEAAAARDLDADRWLDPRITAGVDRIGGRWTVSAEYHFNGLGATDPEGYLTRLGSEAFARGESYFLGRHHLGGLASWTVDAQERVRVSVTVLVNLGDPSGALFPTVSWDLGGSTTLSLGGLVALGEEPNLAGARTGLRSEYGTYGSLGYSRFSLYF
nr:hypothetical protein [Gemmatimonadota bacterium]NIR80281.1 hypothetical protein [Gemmatimonadota bacterium]NIT86881.1 hypothetical protein [Gemmatimonadota bacterium]NIU32837.1 hypothetical protein [Gemmatimonadota bacterium]NIU37257.1 hypothetical protein [Gemmatimonadota bacterium]